MVELKERNARAASVDRQVDVHPIAQGVQQVRSINARGIAPSVKDGKELTLVVANEHDLVAHHLPACNVPHELRRNHAHFVEYEPCICLLQILVHDVGNGLPLSAVGLLRV